MNRAKIGELLIERGHIRPDDLAKALSFQAERGGKLGATLVRMGAVSESNIFECLASQLGYPLIDSAQVDLQAVQDALALLPELRAWLIERRVLAWMMADQQLALGCADPLDAELRETLAVDTRAGEAFWHFVLPSDLDRWMLRIRDLDSDATPLDLQTLKELAEDAPVIAFVNNTISQAAEARASDIHLEPGEKVFAVRFRVDGVLQNRSVVEMSRFPAISSRIKLISGIDIAERRLPQDGRLSARAAGQDMDIRVSSIPAVHGESLVMRLLPKKRSDLKLDRLGMSPAQLTDFLKWLGWPNGLILVTGPTGSGKSTTLYAALSAVSDATRKIITVEDPVEFRLPDVVQIQAQSEIGYTFARALRSILRHDPDIIMVGEIRDRETAEIAIQAALTGHLVLATLHTNDALSAVTRLVDMGVEPYMVAAALRATMAQRLVRRVCESCGVASAEDPALDAQVADIQKTTLGLPESERPRAIWRHGTGCHACNGTGFLGRLAIYELVTVSTRLQHLIASGSSPSELIGLADTEGRLSLRNDGLLKAHQGLTTFAEVLRAAGADSMVVEDESVQ